MEKFKKKLKKRIVFGSVYCGLIPLLAIALHFCVGETLSSGFTLGFACGIAAVSLVFVIQSARALCSDEKLRKMYIAETDERNQYIKNRCAASSVCIILAAVSLATLTASYFDRTIFFTLLAVTYCTVFIIGCCKLYYHRKLS